MNSFSHCEIYVNEKRRLMTSFFFSSGDRTRTDDLWVMSPTSYQLLHPAIYYLHHFVLSTSYSRIFGTPPRNVKFPFVVLPDLVASSHSSMTQGFRFEGCKYSLLLWQQTKMSRNCQKPSTKRDS